MGKEAEKSIKCLKIDNSNNFMKRKKLKDILPLHATTKWSTISPKYNDDDDDEYGAPDAIYKRVLKLFGMKLQNKLYTY